MEELHPIISTKMHAYETHNAFETRRRKEEGREKRDKAEKTSKQVVLAQNVL